MVGFPLLSTEQVVVARAIVSRSAENIQSNRIAPESGKKLINAFQCVFSVTSHRGCVKYKESAYCSGLKPPKH